MSSGDDKYFIDNFTVIENSSEGNDTIYSSVTYAVSDNVETLKLIGSNNIDATWR